MYPVSCPVHAGIGSKPPLNLHRLSSYNNAGVKVFRWLWACIAQLITPILRTDLIPKSGISSFVCINVFVAWMIVIQQRLHTRMCEMRTVEVWAPSEDVRKWPVDAPSCCLTIPAVYHQSWVAFFLISLKLFLNWAMVSLGHERHSKQMCYCISSHANIGCFIFTCHDATSPTQGDQFLFGRGFFVQTVVM